MGCSMPLSLGVPRGTKCTGRPGADETLHGLGDGDLARAGDRAHPGRHVDRRAHVATVHLDGLAGVDADADPDRALGMLATRGSRRVDQRETALDRAAGGIEDDVERVTLGLDLGATELLHRRAHEVPIRR